MAGPLVFVVMVLMSAAAMAFSMAADPQKPLGQLIAAMLAAVSVNIVSSLVLEVLSRTVPP